MASAWCLCQSRSLLDLWLADALLARLTAALRAAGVGQPCASSTSSCTTLWPWWRWSRLCVPRAWSCGHSQCWCGPRTRLMCPAADGNYSRLVECCALSCHIDVTQLALGWLMTRQAYCHDRAALSAAGIVSSACQPDGDALGAARWLASGDAALYCDGGERRRMLCCTACSRCCRHPGKITSFCRHSPEPVQVLSLVGGTVNVLRWPERQFQPAPGRPGRFDYWLNSHQVSVLMWLPMWNGV